MTVSYNTEYNTGIIETTIFPRVYIHSYNIIIIRGTVPSIKSKWNIFEKLNLKVIHVRARVSVKIDVARCMC